jgi:hypothetical protein
VEETLRAGSSVSGERLHVPSLHLGRGGAELNDRRVQKLYQVPESRKYISAFNSQINVFGSYSHSILKP